VEWKVFGIRDHYLGVSSFSLTSFGDFGSSKEIGSQPGLNPETSMRLDGDVEEAKACPEAVQGALEGDQVAVGHDQRVAAFLQVDIVFVSIRYHLQPWGFAEVWNSGEGHGVVCIRQQGLGLLFVPVINLHVDLIPGDRKRSRLMLALNVTLVTFFLSW
jgi:hypothetical protein